MRESCLLDILHALPWEVVVLIEGMAYVHTDPMYYPYNRCGTGEQVLGACFPAMRKLRHGIYSLGRFTCQGTLLAEIDAANRVFNLGLTFNS
jgi:hypothetical protein